MVQLPNSLGGSVGNSAEVIATGVIRANELSTTLVWIAHSPTVSVEEQRR